MTAQQGVPQREGAAAPTSVGTHAETGLTRSQRAQWDAFGFVVLRQLFSAAEMAALTEESATLIDRDVGQRFRQVDGVAYDMARLPPRGTADDARLDRVRSGERVTLSEVVEREDRVGELLVASGGGGRVWQVVAELLGDDFLFAGSELFRGSFNATEDQGFHSDRGMATGGSDEAELAYPRVKMMVYTVPTRANHGALHVIPGSHRSGFHAELVRKLPLMDGQHSAMGEDFPSFVFESNPGGAAVLCQLLGPAA